MVDISGLRIDPDKAKDGVWKTWNGIRFRIGSTTTRAWQEAHRRTVATDRRAWMQMDLLEQLALLAPAIAEHLITGWEDLEEGGQPVPFSKEKARELMRDESLQELRIWVYQSALETDEYRVRSHAEAVGN